MPPILDFLRDSLGSFNIRAMKRGHEITTQLLDNTGLIDVLNELYDPVVRDEFSKNPMSFLGQRGITLPAGSLPPVVHEFANGVWEVELTVVEGAYTYTNGFNSATGFYHR